MRKRKVGAEEKPFPVLNTGRLILRELTAKDLDEFVPVVRNPAVWAWQWTNDLAAPASEWRGWLRGQEKGFREGWHISWAICERESGKLIGNIRLSFSFRERASGELNYFLDEAYWGRGYMTEAVRAVMAYGFGQGGMRRISAYCVRENAASCRVMEKCGMRREGVFLQAYHRDGAYYDEIYYAMLKSEWDEIQQNEEAKP